MTRIEFTTACQDAPGVLSSDFGQPCALTHGRSAFVPYPREDGGTTICDTQADVPSARRLGAQLAFKDSMMISGSYAYDPTKTEVLGMDERITTESAGTVRNRPTESDVSSFSGRSVSRTANHPRRRDPNTSPDHSIGRSDGRTSVAVHQHTYQHAGPWTQPFPWTVRVILAHVGCLFSTDRTSMGVRQHTQYVHVCPSAHTGRLWLSVCVCVSPSAHTGRLWLSISTNISTLVLGLSTVTLPVDCSGDFGPHGLSVQYTQDVRGLSTSTHRTSMAVRVYPCLCPSVHTGRLWLSNSTHISTLVRGLSTMALPVDCSGDFGPRGLFVQYTQNVRGCLPAHTGRPWLSVAVCQHTQDVRGCLCVSVCVRQHTQDVHGCLSSHTGRLCGSVSTHRTFVAVRVCPSAHTKRLWLSISKHISTFVLGLSTLTLPVDCSGDFGPRGLSAQYTQDVCGCPPAHTGLPWLSMCVRQHTQDVCGCPRVSVSTHTTSMGVRQHTQDIRVFPTLVLALSTLALPVDCLRDFGPRGLSVLYTQDVCGCPPAHTGRPWLTHVSTLVLGLSTLALPVDCSGRPCVSVSTHRTFVAVRVCPSAHTGRPWLSISTQSSTLVLGLSTLALPVDCLGDFGPRGLSVQYTQDVRGCPPEHTGRLCLSVAVRPHTQDVSGCLCVSVSTHGTSVGDRQHTQDVRVCPSAHTGGPWLSVCVRQHTQDVCGCPAVHISACWSLDSSCWPFPWTVWVILALAGCLFSTHRTSVGVRQHTQDVRGCLWLSVSTHRTSVALRVCPSAHIGRPCLFISTHISTLVLGLSTLALPVDCSGDFGPRGLSVQYTQDVRGCPSTHRMSVCVCQHTQDIRGCPCVSVRTHRMSVAVQQYTYQHVGHWTQHAAPSRGLFGLFWPTWAVCSVHTGRPWVSASTHRMSVAVNVCPCVTHRTSVGACQHTQDICACLWLSVSTHRTSVAVRVCPWVSVSTHRTSVCVRQNTGRLLLSVCVRQNTHDIRGCPSVHISARWSLDSACWPFPWTVWVILALAGCLFSTHSTSVGVRQHTQDVCGCLWLSVSTHRTSVAVCVCPCVSVSTHRTSVSVHQYTYQHAVRTRRLWVSVNTQDVHVYPSAHTGRPWLSVCVHVCPSTHTGRPWLSISTHISTLVLGLSTLALPLDCLGDFSPRRLSVQYTQDVRGCLPPHTGRLCLSVGVRHHTQDVRGCPPPHTGRSWLSISTHISTLVLGLSTLALPVDCLGDFGPRGLSVQYTQDGTWARSVADDASPDYNLNAKDVRQHTRRPCVSVSTHRTSVAVRVCPCVSVCTHRTSAVCSVHTGRPWVSTTTHRTSVPVRGCPPPHTRRPWVSATTHRTSVAVH
ncbi:hypothetical protein YC2023_108602 [Brassica napus]